MLEQGYPRLYELLKVLLAAAHPVSSEEMARRFNVTKRTIRSDIQNMEYELKAYDIAVRHQRGQGYYLDIADQQKYQELKGRLFTETIKKNQLATPGDRVNYLLEILLRDAKYHTIDQLIDQLYVTKNTLYSYLKTIRDKLDHYNLKLINKTNIGFKLIGEEDDKRACIIDNLIEKNYSSYIVGFSAREKAMFNNIDLDLLSDICNDYVQRYLSEISDYSRKNILLHIALAMSRIRQGYELENFDFVIDSTREKIVKFHELLDGISIKYNLAINPPERSYLLYHLALNDLSLIEENSAEKDTLISSFIEEFIDCIYLNYRFDLRDDYILKENLFIHIRSFVQMQKMAGNRQNPLLEMIQNTFPLPYEMTSAVLKSMPNPLNGDFNNDEISFIALHVGASIERTYNEIWTKKRAAIICGSGTATATLLEAKLLNRFSHNLTITGKYSYSDYKTRDLSADHDFLISTVPLANAAIPVIVIDIANFERDSEQLNAYISSVDEEAQRVLDLFEPDLILLNMEYETKEALMADVCLKLKNHGVVGADFEGLVRERENLAPTVIGEKMAILHPLKLSANISRVTLVTLKNPLEWARSGHPVLLVFVLAITREDYPDTQKLYDFILSLQENRDLRHLLQKCSRPAEVLQLIRSSLFNLR